MRKLLFILLLFVAQNLFAQTRISWEQDSVVYFDQTDIAINAQKLKISIWFDTPGDLTTATGVQFICRDLSDAFCGSYELELSNPVSGIMKNVVTYTTDENDVAMLYLNRNGVLILELITFNGVHITYQNTSK